MKEITCDICMDLMPLVQDGIASEDSRNAVEEHVKRCEQCAVHYKFNTVPIKISTPLSYFF